MNRLLQRLPSLRQRLRQRQHQAVGLHEASEPVRPRLVKADQQRQVCHVQ